MWWNFNFTLTPPVRVEGCSASLRESLPRTRSSFAFSPVESLKSGHWSNRWQSLRWMKLNGFVGSHTRQEVAVKSANWLCIPSRELTYPPKNGILKMIFLFPGWDMLIPWRVYHLHCIYYLIFLLWFSENSPRPSAMSRPGSRGAWRCYQPEWLGRSLEKAHLYLPGTQNIRFKMVVSVGWLQITTWKMGKNCKFGGSGVVFLKGNPPSFNHFRTPEHDFFELKKNNRVVNQPKRCSNTRRGWNALPFVFWSRDYMGVF